jgi:hypothetical protein
LGQVNKLEYKCKKTNKMQAQFFLIIFRFLNSASFGNLLIIFFINHKFFSIPTRIYTAWTSGLPNFGYTQFELVHRSGVPCLFDEFWWSSSFVYSVQGELCWHCWGRIEWRSELRKFYNICTSSIRYVGQLYLLPYTVYGKFLKFRN